MNVATWLATKIDDERTATEARRGILEVSTPKIEVSTFTGVSALQREAITQATRDFVAWYEQQGIRFVSCGASVFQFNGSIAIDPRGLFVYTITVFDIRGDISTPVTRAQEHP